MPVRAPSPRFGAGPRTVLLLALLSAAPAAQDLPKPPRWVQGAFSGTTFVLSFAPETTDWIAVEASDDALRWQELVSVAATSPTTSYADLDARRRGHRVYRLRSPGTRSTDSRDRWTSRPHADYRFHLDRLSSVPPVLVQADIEVRGTTKTVSGIVSDRVPLDPGSGDPHWFPAIDELFERLERARLDGASQVWASYEDALGYPSRCTLDHRGLATGGVDAGALVQYRVSNLVPIPR